MRNTQAALLLATAVLVGTSAQAQSRGRRRGASTAAPGGDRATASAPARPARTPAAPPRRAAAADTDLGDEAIEIRRGRVSVTFNAPAYAVGDSIVATVTNGLPQTIRVLDARTDCSLATLERRDGSRWQPTTACPHAARGRLVAIGSGRTRLIRIAARGGYLEAPPQAGVYRLRVRYQFEPGQPHRRMRSALSPRFSILPPAQPPSAAHRPPAERRATSTAALGPARH